MEVEDALEAVLQASARSESLRRRLPGVDADGRGGGAGRAAANAVVRILLELTEEGDRAAELLLLYFPRVFLVKGASIVEQVEMVMKGGNAEVAPKCIDPVARWLLAMETALESNDSSALVSALDRGPRERDVELDNDEVAAHFPQQRADEREEQQWLEMRARMPSARRELRVKDVKRWSGAHPRAYGGDTGWTGDIIRSLGRGDNNFIKRLTAMWGRDPMEWLHRPTANLAMRETDGWFVDKVGGHRPIAAPQPIRRIVAAAYARECRPLARRFCEARGQWGLSGEMHTLAYSILPLMIVADGGDGCVS